MFMCACLPIPVGPGVIAELRSITQLAFRYSSSITAKSGIIFE